MSKWKINKQGVRVDIEGLFGGECELITDEQFDSVCFVPKESNAARLIASAPETLRALELIYDFMCMEIGDCVDKEGRDMKYYINNVINKAKGL